MPADPEHGRRSVALTGSRSRASDGRRAVQIALGALSWIGFGALWMWQLEVYVPSTWLYSITLIAIILAAWIAFTVCWVRWNRNIYARRHRRTTPVRQEVSFTEDSLGRPIVAPGGIRAADGQIIVSVDEDGAKRYDPARRPLRLPRLPSVKELLPDWDAVPVNGHRNGNGRVAVNGNGNSHAPVNGNGNGHGHALVNGNGHVPVNGNGNGNGNGSHPAKIRERVEEMVR